MISIQSIKMNHISVTGQSCLHTDGQNS